MPAKMPKLLRFASAPPLQRHPRKAPDCRPGSDARNAVAVICAIYEAAKTGRTVQVKQECGRDAPSRSSVCDCSPVFIRLLHGPTVSPSAAASVR
jgi:hypothetical protein